MQIVGSGQVEWKTCADQYIKDDFSCTRCWWKVHNNPMLMAETILSISPVYLCTFSTFLRKNPTDSKGTHYLSESNAYTFNSIPECIDCHSFVLSIISFHPYLYLLQSNWGEKPLDANIRNETRFTFEQRFLFERRHADIKIPRHILRSPVIIITQSHSWH